VGQDPVGDLTRDDLGGRPTVYHGGLAYAGSDDESSQKLNIQVFVGIIIVDVVGRIWVVVDRALNL
jgi:hypothetical protein